MNVIDWLLDADPSIRCQVMRDLTYEPAEVIAAERARIATEGWGAQLLALQAPDGQWGNSPWSHDGTDTFHVLDLLRRLGLDRGSDQARRAVGLVREHVIWRGYYPEDDWDGNAFFDGEVEPCINGNVVATGSYFGVDMAPLERATSCAERVAVARRRGEEYLLERRLFRRRTTGEVIDPGEVHLQMEGTRALPADGTRSAPSSAGVAGWAGPTT